MKKLIILSCFVTNTIFTKAQTKTNYKSGDLLFISSAAGQGMAIQLATKSNLTHCGIIFVENNVPYVYHAVEPVQKSTLSEFLEFSADGKLWAKRLKDTSMLTLKNIAQLKSKALNGLGKHYDSFFNWSSNELYCSEYIWKIYYDALKIEIGLLHPLKDYDLKHPIVQETMKKRYGENIPYNEMMVAPKDIFISDLLMDLK